MISSYITISYLISYENRMNEDTVPYQKTPERARSELGIEICF